MLASHLADEMSSLIFKSKFRAICLGVLVGMLCPLISPTPTRAQEPPAELADDEIAMSADELVYDGSNGIVTASGAVIVRHQGYVLRAEKVTYDERTGVVTAEGAVKILDPNGNVLSADNIELTDTLKDGVIENVRLLLEDGSRIAALRGERTGQRTRFNRAVYSPCLVCSEEETPLWQIKAVRVVHDQEKKRVYYRNAFLEVFGIPVFYLPWLSHPDPSVERASGFLIPELKQSPELGIVLEVPYFWNISDRQDLTLTPVLTTDEGPVLASEYRHHVGYGLYSFEGSLTYTDERDDQNQKTGREIFRGHIFSEGIFKHSSRSRSRLNIRYASDDTYLRRYDISNEDTLRNHYIYERFSGRSYLAAEGLAFQGLRIEDIAGLTPFALPSVDYFHETAPLLGSGRVKSRFNLLSLNRTAGLDTQRLSGSTAYVMPHVFSSGVVAELNAGVRGDIYHVSDAARPDNPAFNGENGTEARVLPRLAVDLRWPLINTLFSWNQTLEPIVTLVAAPNGGNPAEIPNEDSRAFDLDDSNLFALDRFPGLDRWEGGARATYGVRWTLLGRRFDFGVLFGQSLRFDTDAASFPRGTGLSGNFSDFVGRVNFALPDLIEFSHRFRIDERDFAVRRNEIDMRLGDDERSLTVGYVKLNRDLFLGDLRDREELRLSGRLRLARNWAVTGGTIQDLTTGRDSIANSAGLIYSDECLEFRLNYRKNFTEDRDFEPGTTVTVQIRLKNLG